MERFCVAWKAMYSVGEDSLDAQHEEIIEAIDDLITARADGQTHAAIKTLLDRLSYCMFSHIRHEEQLMRNCKYPDIAQHKVLHDQFWQTVRDLPEYVHLPTGHNLLCFFKEWWMKHIQEQDKKYSPYLQQAASSKKILCEIMN
jgi:hemerythrin-like metal-binding protein